MSISKAQKGKEIFIIIVEAATRGGEAAWCLLILIPRGVVAIIIYKWVSDYLTAIVQMIRKQ